MPTFDPTNLEGRDRISHIETYLLSPFFDSMVRSQGLTRASGLLAEPYPWAMAENNAPMLASRAHSTAVYLRAGDVVTNIVTWIATAQAPGIFQGGLHDKTGKHLGHTASLGASIVGSQAWIAPLLTPVKITTDDAYYVSLVSQGAATQPSLLFQQSNTNFGSNTFGGILLFNGSNAAADLTIDLTSILGQSPSNRSHYIACS